FTAVVVVLEVLFTPALLSTNGPAALPLTEALLAVVLLLLVVFVVLLLLLLTLLAAGLLQFLAFISSSMAAIVARSASIRCSVASSAARALSACWESNWNLAWWTLFWREAAPAFRVSWARPTASAALDRLAWALPMLALFRACSPGGAASRSWLTFSSADW